MKNWVAEGIASDINDFNRQQLRWRSYEIYYFDRNFLHHFLIHTKNQLKVSQLISPQIRIKIWRKEWWSHSWFLEHWNSQKIICNIRHRFSYLLDEWIEKICKNFFFTVAFFKIHFIRFEMHMDRPDNLKKNFGTSY